MGLLRQPRGSDPPRRGGMHGSPGSSAPSRRARASRPGQAPPRGPHRPRLPVPGAGYRPAGQRARQAV